MNTNLRPKRNIRPPILLKEYVILNEKKDSQIIPIKYLKKPSQTCIPPQLSLPNEAINNKPGNNVYCCKKCGLKFTNKGDLNIHSKKHEGRRRNFLCEDCGKSLSSLQSFTEHLNIHKNIKPFKCQICGHRSRQWSVHSRHLSTHNKDVNSYVCTICSKAFTSKVYLKCHINKHLKPEIKPFSCKKCLKNFPTQRELNRHNVSHSSVKPFECPQCNHKFKLKHNLKAHIRTHTGKQVWKCQVCKCSFPQRSSLKAHLHKHRESVQQVELAKADDKTLNVITFPSDGRKVAQFQKLNLPKNLSLDDEEGLKKSKFALFLNEIVFPLSVVANSFGTGNFITVKIIGPKEDEGTTSQTKKSITAFISEIDDNTQGDKEKSQHASILNVKNIDEFQERNHNKDSNSDDELKRLLNMVEKNGVTMETVLHFQKIISIINKLDLPLTYSVSEMIGRLNIILQNYLIQNVSTINDNISSQSADSINANISKEAISSNAEENVDLVLFNNENSENQQSTKTRENLSYNGINIEYSKSSDNDSINISLENIQQFAPNETIKTFTVDKTNIKKSAKINCCNLEPLNSDYEFNSSKKFNFWNDINSCYALLNTVLQQHFNKILNT